jgi:anti-sigma B factor antagonist
MSVSVTVTGSIARLHLSGDFDFSKQEELGQALEQALVSGAGQIELDLAQATFVDSSVLRLLVRVHDRARRANQTLTISHCNERVIDIFRIGGFDQIFEIR